MSRPRRPAWDDSIVDASKYRLSSSEMLRRKKSLMSKHNVFSMSADNERRTSKPKFSKKKKTKKLNGIAGPAGREGEKENVAIEGKKDLSHSNTTSPMTADSVSTTEGIKPG